MTIRQTRDHQELFQNRARQVSKTLSNSSIHSQESCSSTLPSRITKQSTHQTCPPRRRVSFCESKSIIYENTTLCKEECRELWFSPEEMQGFKTSTAILSRRVLTSSNPKYQTWINELTMAYEGFTKVSCADDMQQILELSYQTPFNPFLMGLEKWTLRRIAHDKALRRKNLLEVIREEKHDLKSSNSYKIKQTRKASREISRPSRLFAHHVALASLHAEC